jgi:hypothetical protein
VDPACSSGSPIPRRSDSNASPEDAFLNQFLDIFIGKYSGLRIDKLSYTRVGEVADDRARREFSRRYGPDAKLVSPTSALIPVHSKVRITESFTGWLPQPGVVPVHAPDLGLRPTSHKGIAVDAQPSDGRPAKRRRGLLLRAQRAIRSRVGGRSGGVSGEILVSVADAEMLLDLNEVMNQRLSSEQEKNDRR